MSDTAAGSGLLLAHEWIASIGGSENVFRSLMDTFPDADAVCLWNDVPDTFGRPVAETPLADGPLRGRKALALPFMPRAWRAVDLDAYDAVLASSHAFSHHLAGQAAREGRGAFAYVHTPARYVWAPEVEVRGQAWTARVGSIPLKRIDRRAVDARVNYAANSGYIRDRIRRSWDVDAEVIYPPIRVERIRSVTRWRDALSVDEARLFETMPTDGYVLGASRLVSYKRLDLAMQVGQELGMPVVIAGAGPDEPMLKAQAETMSVPVIFTGRVSDAQLYALYQEASLFVFMAIEDFGIMPVECMAASTPVLVNATGGSKEAVTVVGLGAQADPSSPAEIREGALAALASTGGSLDAVQEFSEERFRSRVRGWVAPIVDAS